MSEHRCQFRAPEDGAQCETCGRLIEPHEIPRPRTHDTQPEQVNAAPAPAESDIRKARARAQKE